MDKHPNEMLTEELDCHYGEPVRQPMVFAVVSTAWNDNHNIIAVEVVNEQNSRLVIPFTQAAIKSLVSMCGDYASAAERPKAH
ncbi:MAG: hypothetical protein ACLQJR_09135 [Stellaceae bacterium]